MNDEQLTRLFRSLDEPAEPSPAFADALFAELEREAGHAATRRRTSVRWVLLAATLLLVVALGAALAVGTGLLKLPSVVAVASPTPLPSASPTPLPSASPTASAQQTAAPTPSIPELAYLSGLAATPDGFLAVGAVSTSASAAPAPSVILRGANDGMTWQASRPSRFGEVASLATSHSVSILLTNTVQDLSGRWVIWRATDGQGWSSNEAWTSDARAEPVAVAGGPAGFVIWGVSDSSTLPAHVSLWTSPDGNSWKRSSINSNGVGGALVLDNAFLVHASEGFLASLDGVVWEPVSSPVGASGAYVAGLFRVGSDLVAVTCEGTQLNPCSVWTGRLAGSAGSLSLRWQAAAGGQFLSGYAFTTATGASNRGFLFGYDIKTYEREVWTSTDGANWTRAALAADAFGGGMPGSFVAGQSAVLGVGWTESTLAGTGRELWRSADGLSWTPANAPLVPPAPLVPGGPCPAAPTTIQQLLDIGFVKAASCYGSSSLTIHAYSSACGGCGGTGFPTTMSPAWIADIHYGDSWHVSPAVTTAGGPGTRAIVWLLPSAHLTRPAEGTPVVITGHFNDPVSADCRIVPVRNAVELPPTSDASAACERSFVVTAITVGG